MRCICPLYMVAICERILFVLWTVPGAQVPAGTGPLRNLSSPFGHHCPTSCLLSRATCAILPPFGFPASTGLDSGCCQVGTPNSTTGILKLAQEVGCPELWHILQNTYFPYRTRNNLASRNYGWSFFSCKIKSKPPAHISQGGKKSCQPVHDSWLSFSFINPVCYLWAHNKQKNGSRN